MKFCSRCGAAVTQKIPPGETLHRFVCPACETIHYQNPKIVAGCIPEWEGQILLCRRAIEPKHGLWTYPAGFMEMGESVEQAAIRETLEEAKARVEITGLHGVFSLVHVDQVYMVFRGTLHAKEYGVGHESSEVQLFHPDQIPWDELAFPVIRESLQRYMQDRRAGRFTLHIGVIAPKPK